MALSLRERMNASMAKLRETAESSQNSESPSGDSIYWKLTTDDALNGQAVIRFLPQRDLDRPAFVEAYSYYFKNKRTKNHYSDQASRTFGRGIPDPVSEFNSWCWSLSESDDVSPQEKAAIQDACKTRAQKHQYYSNILVISDKAKPENEGKVFVYRYGKKIYEKIHAQMYPKFDDDVPCIPFDMFEGKNFRLVSKKVNDFANYDDSTFSAVTTSVADTDEGIEEILAMCHDLDALILDPTKATSYEKKLERLKRVMGPDDELFNEWLSTKGEEVAPARAKKPARLVEKDDDDGDEPVDEVSPAPKSTKAKQSKPTPQIAAAVDDDVDDILRDLGF